MSSYIDVNDDQQLYAWARTLGMTPQDLVRLVGQVGPSAQRVRDAMKRSELACSGGRRLPQAR